MQVIKNKPNSSLSYYTNCLVKVGFFLDSLGKSLWETSLFQEKKGKKMKFVSVIACLILAKFNEANDTKQKIGKQENGSLFGIVLAN